MLCNMSEPGWLVLHANQGWQQALPQQGGALTGKHLTDIFPIAEDSKVCSVSFNSCPRCLAVVLLLHLAEQLNLPARIRCVCDVPRWPRHRPLLQNLNPWGATAYLRKQRGHQAQAVAASCSAFRDLCAMLQEGAAFALSQNHEFTLAVGEMQGRSMLLRFRWEGPFWPCWAVCNGIEISSGSPLLQSTANCPSVSCYTEHQPVVHKHSLLSACPILLRWESCSSDVPGATHCCLTLLSPTLSQPAGFGSHTCRPASKPQLDSSAPLVGLPSFLEPANTPASTGLYFVSLMEDTPSLVNSAGSEVRHALQMQCWVIIKFSSLELPSGPGVSLKHLLQQQMTAMDGHQHNPPAHKAPGAPCSRKQHKHLILTSCQSPQTVPCWHLALPARCHPSSRLIT